MLDLFKMYCYKMFRQKSLYIIWLFMFGFEMLTVFTTKGGFTEVTVEMGGFYLIFSSIFTAIFFSGDISSGFIKNYAGSVSNRSTIIGSRMVMILVQNLLTQAVLFVSLLGIAMFKGITLAGNAFFVRYYICMFLAGLACSFLSMMFTELTRRTVPAVILTISVGTGLISQFAATVSALFSNGRFNIGNYMVTGSFNQLNLESATGEFKIVMIIAICYSIVSVAISILSINKQDVV